MSPGHRHAGMGRGLKRMVWLSSALLWASGLGWCVLHYTVGAGGAEGLPHPAEPWLMKLHGLALFLNLMALGAVVAQHLPPGWRMGQRPAWRGQRRTGLWLGSLFIALVASGYLLYYFGGEDWRPTLDGVHIAAGVLLAVPLLWHAGRRRAARAMP